MDLATVAGELYALTPEEFTKARNERAAEVKAEGDKELAESVKRLAKPSLAAWVVNMLVRHNTEQMEQVLDLGASLRQAQENLDGTQLRELTRQRRQLTSAVTAQARSLAADLGHRLTDAVAQRVEETLHAAMIDEAAAGAVRSGLLTEALTATGLGPVDLSESVAVPGLVGAPAPRPKKKRPELAVVQDDARALEEAEAEAEEAATGVVKAQKKLDKAVKRVAKLEARGLELQARLDELKRQVSEVEHQLEGLDDELSSAEGQRDETEQRLAAAQKTADDAQVKLAKLRD